MKKMFKSFHKPTEKEFKGLWDSCLFVVDTNVLLNLYRYTESTRTELINILEKIKDNLWMPYQVGLEFHENRIKVILDQTAAYDQLIQEIEQFETEFKKKINTKYSKHSTIDSKEFTDEISKAVNNLKKKIEDKKNSHPDLINNDDLLDTINKFYEDKIGEPYDKVRLEELYKEAEVRFKDKIPPGFLDDKKDGNKKYSDYIIWSQLIDKAIETKKPIIFITEDLKEDWWLRVSGKTIGPKPELISEIEKKANVDFYMYASGQFIGYAAKHLKASSAKNINTAIEEIQEVRKKNQSVLDKLNEQSEMVRLLGFGSETENHNESYERLFKNSNPGDWKEYFEKSFKDSGIPKFSELDNQALKELKELRELKWLRMLRTEILSKNKKANDSEGD